MTLLMSGRQLFTPRARVVLNLAESLLHQVQVFLAANPELLVVMIGLIPISLIWLLRFSPRRRRHSDTAL